MNHRQWDQWFEACSFVDCQQTEELNHTGIFRDYELKRRQDEFPQRWFDYIYRMHCPSTPPEDDNVPY